MITKRPVKCVEKTWGYELWFANDAANNYCGKLLHIRAHERFSMHFHQNKIETFYVLRGPVKLRTVDYTTGQVEEQLLTGGDAVEITRLLAHQLEALDTDVEIVEASTFHEDADSYRLWR